MTYEQYKQEVFEEIDNVTEFPKHQIDNTIIMCYKIIMDCYKREVTAEDCVELIFKGNI